MNERLIVKSFGPVKDLDIIFKKVTLFIGDQGTGKSCVAKLFSMFKWMEKVKGYLILRAYDNGGNVGGKMAVIMSPVCPQLCHKLSQVCHKLEGDRLKVKHES